MPQETRIKKRLQRWDRRVGVRWGGMEMKLVF